MVLDGPSQQNANIAIAEHVAGLRVIDTIGYATGKGDAPDCRFCGNGAAVIGIQASMVSILGEKSQCLGQMTGHNGAELVKLLLLGRVPYFQGQPMFFRQRMNLGENPADSPLLHFDQAASDVKTADTPQSALFV